MNLIEAQWHQLKTYEIAGRIFDNEYDLANAIMKAWRIAANKVGGYWSVLRLNPPSYLLNIFLPLMPSLMTLRSTLLTHPKFMLKHTLFVCRSCHCPSEDCPQNQPANGNSVNHD